MIIGIGTDIVRIHRIERALLRFGERFLNKVFTDKEAMVCQVKIDQASGLAARFAAKEAVLKALGTGISNGIGLKDVEVERTQGKRPEIILHGKGKEMAKSLGVKHIHISISHESDIALAFAVIEG